MYLHIYTNIYNSPVFISNILSDTKLKHSLRMVNKGCYMTNKSFFIYKTEMNKLL